MTPAPDLPRPNRPAARSIGRVARALTAGFVLGCGEPSEPVRAPSDPPRANAPAATAPAATPAETGPAPRLSVVEPVVDVGDLLKGESREVEFEVRNAGDVPLVIRRVQTVCGCTVASLRTAEGPIAIPLPGAPPEPGGLATLEPGAGCTIRVEFQSATQPLGKLEKHVTLHTNERNRPEFPLTIRASIQQPFVIEPESIVFGELKRGETPTRRMTLRADALKDVRVIGFDDVPAFLHARVERDESDPDVQIIEISLTREAPVGLLQHTIKARLDHPTFEHLPIPVFATVKSRLRVDTGNPENRERIDFEVLRIGEETKRSVEIATEVPDETFHVTSVDVESKHDSIIRAEIVALVPGSRYRVDVFARPTEETKARFLRGSLNIHSDHPDLTVKTITFQGWLKSN